MDFGLIDFVVALPNVHSFVFKDQEGSYLAGVLAALASRPARSASSAAWTSR